MELFRQYYVIGGDCSVTQTPFDYLKGKYGEKIGIIWLDAHPDTSSRKQSSHLHEMDEMCRTLKLSIASPEKLRKSRESVCEWIQENKLEYVAVHWDLDVLSPADFRSIYPAEPYLEAKDFGAAIGRMTLEDVSKVLADAETVFALW